jgi:hypothetical protein
MEMDLSDRFENFGVAKTLACLAMLSVMLCVFSSCARDIASRYYGTMKYPSKLPDEVELLRECPTRPYDVIADFQSRGETAEDMRRKAAQIGADAVIVSTLGGYRAIGEEWAGEDSYSNTYTRITATAIKYRE